MFHHQRERLLDLKDGGEEEAQSPSLGRNVDPDLFNDLVEMVPLVQSLLIDRKVSSSFTRRGSMICTKTPSRDSLYKKANEVKGRNATQSIPTKKHRDRGDKQLTKYDGNGLDGCAESISVSSRSLEAEKDKEELISLRQQLDDLQQKLAEKDDMLKTAEVLKNEMASIHAKLDELRNEVAEKDSLLKSSQLQLSDAKINLADKQAALEKLHWEAMISNRKMENLREDLEMMRGEISLFMQFVDGLRTNNCTLPDEDYDVLFPKFPDYISNMQSEAARESHQLEAVMDAYLSAVAIVKERRDEESLAVAAKARQDLRSFVLN